MKTKKVIRILPNGDRETVFATDLKVGDRFVDEVRQQEGIVAEVSNGQIKYHLPDGSLAFDDIFDVRGTTAS